MKPHPASRSPQLTCGHGLPEPQTSATPAPPPSEIDPQFLPCAAHVVGVHAPTPQTLGVEAPQVCPDVQLPQFRVPPQPSGTEPQFLPNPEQLAAVQPQTFAVPPPPQVCP